MLHLIIAISRHYNQVNHARAARLEAWFTELYKGVGTVHKWTLFASGVVAKLCDTACDDGSIPKGAKSVTKFHTKLYDEWKGAVDNSVLPDITRFAQRGQPHEASSLNHPTQYSGVIRLLK